MCLLSVNKDIGIDLGTASILVYIKGRGIVLREPSVVAIDKNRDRILSIGEEARNMIGRTPGNIIAKRPLREGVISDYEVTEKMLKFFIKKANGTKGWSKPKVVVCIPCEATEVERRAVKHAAINAGAGKVYLIEEPIAAALGAGLDISKPSGHMIVDIGGGTTDVAVISLNGAVIRAAIKVAGDKFDESIIKYVRREHKIMIGERTSEALKINIGCAVKRDEDLSMEIKGRDMITGLPKNIFLTSDEIKIALQDATRAIVNCIHSVLERTPPELAADISEKGILLTGGGSLLWGLDKYIEREIKVPVMVAEEAISCVALGTGVALEHEEILSQLPYAE